MSTASGPASFELLVGPLLIGVVVNAFVFGICIMQLVEYFLGRHRDSWKLLALLAWVFAIDVFQVASSVAMLWHYVVANFTNPAALASGPWEYATLPIFNALTTLPIQHFMAWRIMRFARSRTLFAFLSALSLAQAALGCAAAAGGLRSTALAAHVAIVPLADAWLAASVACDMSITVLLMYYLNKSRTGFERTDSVISRICRVTVEAAVPVTFLCLLDLIFLTTTPNNNLHYMFALPVGRLYTNTLLSTLNERESLRRSLEGDNSTPSRQGQGKGQGQGQGISLGALTSSASKRTHPVRITIAQAVDVRMDAAHSDSDADAEAASPWDRERAREEEEKRAGSPRFTSLTPVEAEGEGEGEVEGAGVEKWEGGGAY